MLPVWIWYATGGGVAVVIVLYFCVLDVLCIAHCGFVVFILFFCRTCTIFWWQQAGGYYWFYSGRRHR